MGLNTIKASLQQIIAQHGIEASVEVEHHFDEPTIKLVASNLTPIKRKQVLESLETLPQVEFDHSYTPSNCQKAYDILRNQNPSHYIGLDPNFNKVAYHETIANGRKAVELVQEVLIGTSPYSYCMWNKQDLFPLNNQKITLQEANQLIKTSNKIPSIIFEDVRLLDFVKDQRITIEVDGYLSVFKDSAEIYSHFICDFTVNSKNEVSVEFCDPNLTIYCSDIDVYDEKNNHIDLDSGIDSEILEHLTPTDAMQETFITLFKEQNRLTWAFEDMVSKYAE